MLPAIDRSGALAWRLGRTALRPVAVAALTLSLCACVEYHEHIVLSRDGSGTVEMTIGMNEAIARAAQAADQGNYTEASIVKSIGAVPGLVIRSSRTESASGTRRVHVSLAFHSIAALDGLDRAEGYSGLFGHIALTRDADGNPVLTRTIAIDAKRFVDAKIAARMLGSVLSGYHWRYEVQFPTRVVHSNATAVDTDTHTARWDLTLADVVGEPRVLRATYARSGIGFLGVVVAAVLMLAAIGVGVLVSRRSRRATGARPPAAGIG